MRIRFAVGCALLWTLSGGCSETCGCGGCPPYVETGTELACDSVTNHCLRTGVAILFDCASALASSCSEPSDTAQLKSFTECLSLGSCNVQAATACEQDSGVSVGCAAALNELVAALGPCRPGPEDPCVAVGYACNQVSPGTFACGPPSELNAQCQSSVGCSNSLICTRVFGSTLQGDGGIFTCQPYDCTATSECALPDYTCPFATCDLNRCGPRLPDAGGAYFAPCPIDADAGAGQCLPGSCSTYYYTGLCYEVGTAGIGDSCYPTRSSAAPLCATGGFCFVGQTTGRCLPLCTNSPYCGAGGPAPCADGGTCIYAPANQDWGGCAMPCPCPAGMTCTELPDDAGLVCLPS